MATTGTSGSYAVVPNARTIRRKSNRKTYNDRLQQSLFLVNLQIQGLRNTIDELKCNVSSSRQRRISREDLLARRTMGGSSAWDYQMLSSLSNVQSEALKYFPVSHASNSLGAQGQIHGFNGNCVPMDISRDDSPEGNAYVSSNFSLSGLPEKDGEQHRTPNDGPLFSCLASSRCLQTQADADRYQVGSNFEKQFNLPGDFRKLPDVAWEVMYDRFQNLPCLSTDNSSRRSSANGTCDADVHSSEIVKPSSEFILGLSHFALLPSVGTWLSLPSPLIHDLAGDASTTWDEQHSGERVKEILEAYSSRGVSVASFKVFEADINICKQHCPESNRPALDEILNVYKKKLELRIRAGVRVR